MDHVLMIAFHYPPYAGGSGVHRTLKFSRYLPRHGWQPVVLTSHVRAYPQTSTHQLSEIPADVVVKRAFALDTSRHLAVRGSYIGALALPDRWVTWLAGAVPAGLSLIRQYRPRAIWSTYPIATAHCIGGVLAKLTGLPWIVDFRDSMTEDNYPRDPTTRRVYQWIERQALARGAECIFTAPSTKDLYLSRYSWLDAAKCTVVPNGYDEHDFQDLHHPERQRVNGHRPMRLIHAGVVYPAERDPRPLFRALARLKQDGIVSAQTVRFEFRGAGSEGMYTAILQDLGIEDLVHLLPPLPYRDSLQDCRDADGLLLLQGSSCNHQIPAKAYEYLRLQRPILALTDTAGDTAAVLAECGGTTICDLHSEDALYRAIPGFLQQVKHGTHEMASLPATMKYSRESQAAALAAALRRRI